ncbi:MULTISPECIES: cytidylate kinase family protein [unclassified Variovorax]|jgi:cytidylate kinase|uniref:cytidylate kinase family protein n=1 Tax=unclassified Variovorax TaxID=663243 RepID=UPI000F7DE699|nr:MULTISPECIES: cytidylate kinase family protein [unclassified Variovorax]RSZ41144.1 BON domain-containing protein [Variovorax sp. 553]RSZ41948.1 BON domain-containing protein [Variovorax sp. 679]
MPVIALTQEMGSLAKDVSLKLAETLGLAVMRHEVIEHVADRMQVSTSLIGRLRSGKAGLVERLTTDRRSVALYTAEELFALADRGNVVLRGWGATCLLRPVPHVVCVRITRSLKKRVEWLMADLETDDADFAEAEIRRSDQAHAARMHAQFGVTWGDPVLYDLVLNTDRLSVESCVEQIRLMVNCPEFAETPASRALLANMALEARVRAALKEHEATRDINVTIAANHGEVLLRGIVLNSDERAQTEAVAAEVSGVSGVHNQLRLMASTRRFASAKQT